MTFRTSVAIRRALIFVSFGFLIAGAAITENPLVFFTMFPVVLLAVTDVCFGCGNVLFFVRGNTFWSWVNPLYVPKSCPKCRREI